jgi:tripartite ATP-independent transporter DctP family solute receptor
MPAHAQVNVKVGHVLAANSQFSVIIKAMNDEIGARTNGKFKLVEYAASGLGTGPAMLEATKGGAQDMIISSTGGALSTFNPAIGILDLVGLIKNPAHADTVLDGPIGQELLDSFSTLGIKGLAWGENGFRHLTNSVRPVTGPKDIEGLKVRLSESKIYFRAFEILKAKPVSIPFSNLYQALQTGQVDAQENPVATIVDSKIYEVQKNLTVSGHSYAAAVIGASMDFFNDLSPAEQAIFIDAARKGAKASRDYVRGREKEGLDKIRAAGVTVTTNFDHAAFVQALEPFYKEYAQVYTAAKIDAIKALAK